MVWIAPLWVAYKWKLSTQEGIIGAIYSIGNYKLSNDNLWILASVEAVQDTVLGIAVIIAVALLTKIFYKQIKTKKIIITSLVIYGIMLAYSFLSSVGDIKDLYSLDSYPNQINRQSFYYSRGEGFEQPSINEITFQTSDPIEKVFQYYMDRNFPNMRNNSDVENLWGSIDDQNSKVVYYGAERSYLWVIIRKEEGNPMVKVTIIRKFMASVHSQ